MVVIGIKFVTIVAKTTTYIFFLSFNRKYNQYKNRNMPDGEKDNPVTFMHIYY